LTTDRKEASKRRIPPLPHQKEETSIDDRRGKRKGTGTLLLREGERPANLRTPKEGRGSALEKKGGKGREENSSSHGTGKKGLNKWIVR